MATETLQPDGSVFALTNLSGAATDVDEGVDSPGGDWLTLGDDAADSIVRCSFPTPSGDLNTGAGLQKFRCYVRVGTEAAGNTPTLDFGIRETGGGADLAVQTGISITSYTGEVIEFTWDASVLAAVNGSAVEAYIVGQRSGGNGAKRRCVEFDAIEWVVDYATVGAQDIVPAVAVVTVTPGTLTVTTGAVSIVPAAVVITVTPGALTVTVGPVSITPEPVTISVTPGTLIITTGPVSITPEPVTINVTPGTVVVTQVTPIALAAAVVSVIPGTLIVVPGPVSLSLVGAVVTISGGTVIIGTGEEDSSVFIMMMGD